MKTNPPAIEPLEPRIAPASAFVTYSDLDGDLVKITASSPAGAPPLDPTDLTLSNGPGNPGQLQSLNLTDPLFHNASITFAVTIKPGGDGLAHVGRIDATMRDLGNVTVKGDLAVLDCGDGDGSAVKLLSARSMGIYGLATQGGAGDLQSDIIGGLGALKVTGDVKHAFINVNDAEDGKIGSVTIGGSLIGGLEPSNRSGNIRASTGMGVVRITGDIMGGEGAESGVISANGQLTSLTIGGSLIGGAGSGSGAIVGGDFGAVNIGKDLVGGEGPTSGRLNVSGTIASVKVRGSVLNGGDIRSTGTMGPVSIGGDLTGDIVTIDDGSKITSVTVDGSVTGSAILTNSGAIGPVKIGGDLIDTFIAAQDGTLGAVTIGGSFIGVDTSSEIKSGGTMGAVKIGGDVMAGRIQSLGDANITSVTIGGSLIGGTFAASGSIFSGGDLGPVKIGGDLRGGSISGTEGNLDSAGYIHADRIVSVSIGGSIIAGTDDSTGGFLIRNASIRADHDIGAISVKGSLIGNNLINGIAPVVISARGQETVAPDATIDLAIKSVTIGGRVEFAQIVAGYGENLNGSNGDASIGAVSIGGDWRASNLVAGIADLGDPGFGTDGDVVINNTGAPIFARIASILIKGIVVGSAAGGDHFGFTAEQIGSFKSLGFTAPLTGAPTPDSPVELSLITADVTIREV